MKQLIISTILASVILSVITAPILHAQQANIDGGQALEIGPPVLHLTADPGQVITADINIRDVSATDLIVTNEVNDFTADGETGTPKISLNNDEVSPFSIRSWVSPIDQLLLSPKEIKSVPVTIYVPEDAAPGGYYGTIRFTGTPPNVDGSGVSLNASIGTLIFIQVNGDAKEQLSISEFYANSNGDQHPLYEYKPITLSVRIKNDGNIYEEPTGVINLKDMFGKTIFTAPVNVEQKLILPDSVRRFDQVIDDSAIGPGLMFGRYTAEVTMKYGSSEQTVSATTSFWVIPYTLVLFGIGFLIAAFFVFRYLIRRYNRSIIRKAGGRGGYGGGRGGSRYGGGGGGRYGGNSRYRR